MTGRFIAVVGPSGVGKDSVMQRLASTEPGIMLARRVISRPSAAGGEDYDGVTETQFDLRQLRGDFALRWRAHGLRYGIPASIDGLLAAGQDVLANLSRRMLAEAAQRFERTDVILLTAPDDVLAARLTARGRETKAEITRRLDRAPFDIPTGIIAHRISNAGTLDQTIQAVRTVLYPKSAQRCS